MRKIWIANNIDKDILDAVDSGIIPEEPIVDKGDEKVKCSKSVVPNALYYISKGEEVEFILGTIGQREASLISHCWIKHNKEILQTNVFNPNQKLFENYAVVLPADIEKAKQEIRDLIEKVRNVDLEAKPTEENK